MELFPGMQDAAIIVAVVCAFFAGVLCTLIWVATRRARRSELDDAIGAPKPWRIDWFGGIIIALALVGITSFLSPRDEADQLAEREQARATILTHLGCPEKQPGDTDIITLTFETTADLHTDRPYKASGCARYAERGWVGRSAIAAAQ